MRDVFENIFYYKVFDKKKMEKKSWWVLEVEGKVRNGLRRWPTKYISTLSFCVSRRRRLLQSPKNKTKTIQNKRIFLQNHEPSEINGAVVTLWRFEAEGTHKKKSGWFSYVRVRWLFKQERYDAVSSKNQPLFN